MKTTFPFILILFLSFSVEAQLVVMKEGQHALLVNHKGDSIWGKAELDMDNKVVQLRGEHGFRVVDLQKVVSLRLYDEEEHSITAYRRYKRNNQESEFLEQVVIGDIHFLRKYRSQTYVNNMGSTMLNTINEVEENQYFLWEMGELTKVKNFKKQLSNLMTEKEALLMEDYRKTSKLRYHKEYDQALMVDYLNTLRGQPHLAHIVHEKTLGLLQVSD